MNLFIYSFIHLFIYSFIHLYIYSFIHSFIYSFIHLFTHSFIHSLFVAHIQSAFPKGEVNIGTSDAYAVTAGTHTDYAIVLRTPSRVYHLSAETETDRAEWIAAIKVVMGTPLAPHERKSAGPRGHHSTPHVIHDSFFSYSPCMFSCSSKHKYIIYLFIIIIV